MKICARLIAIAAALCAQLTFAEARPNPICAVLVQPEVLSSKTQRHWLEGPGIKLPGDKLACNFYKKNPPGGLSLAVRYDAKRYEYTNAQNSHARDNMEPANGFGEGFYYRHNTDPPFESTVGLVVYDQKTIFRLEGIPVGTDVSAARKLCREIIERTLRHYGHLK